MEPYENVKALIARPLRAMLGTYIPSWSYYDDIFTPKKLKQEKQKNYKFQYYFSHFTQNERLLINEDYLEKINLPKIFGSVLYHTRDVWSDETMGYWDLSDNEYFASIGMERKIDNITEPERIGELVLEPQTFPTLIMIILIEIIAFHYKFLLKREGKDNYFRYKLKLHKAYQYIFAQYNIDPKHDNIKENSDKRNVIELMLKIHNTIQLLKREFNILIIEQ